MGPNLSSRKLFPDEDILFFLCFVFIFLFLFYQFFFQANVFFDRDSSLLEIPLRIQTVELLKEGNFALWTDAHGQGQPFLANPKTAIFYPTTWLYLILPFFVAFKVHYLIHPLAGWLGLYLLGKSYGLTRKASFLASSLFFLGGMYLSSFEFYNHIAAITWMMWALYLQALNLPLKSPRFILNPLIWALLIFAGAPEFIIITFIVSLAQIFIFAESQEEIKARFGKLILAFALASFLTSIQLLPALQLMQESGRGVQGGLWSLELPQWPDLVFPGFLGDDRSPGRNAFWGAHLISRGYPLYYSLYASSGLFILALTGMMRNLRYKKEAELAVLAGIFFLLACGKYSPVFFIYEKIPFISFIRYPIKYFIGSLLALVLLAGLGFDRLKGGQAGRNLSRKLFTAGIIAVITFFILKKSIWQGLSSLFVITDRESLNLLIGSLVKGLILLLLYGGLVFLINRTEKHRKIFSTFLILICLGDLFFHNRFINPVVDQSFFAKPHVLNELKDGPAVFRDSSEPFSRMVEKVSRKTMFTYYRQSLYPYSGIAYGVRYVLNNDLMATYSRKDRELTARILELPPAEKVKILQYLGCQYFIGEKPLQPDRDSKVWKISGYEVFWQKISDQPARPRLVFKAVIVSKREDNLTTFIQPDFSPDDSAILNHRVEHYEYQSIRDVDPSGVTRQPEVVIIDKKPGSGKYRVDTPRPGILIIPGNYARGWKAWIDGKRVEVFEANIFSKGVGVPGGSHLITLRYLPDSFIIGGLISIITLIGTIGLWSYFSLRPVKRGRS
ncbi:MAG: YfhO family protein [Candidatus Saccharicenans sp.]|uniref:YfhO family protein n=1 Tax=Candidatus Saccharicenans sp. TaxID=2819258 RepID=UPI004048FA60